MTYVQPHLIQAHASLIHPPSGRSGGSGGVTPVTTSGAPTAHWYHDAQGNKVFLDPNRQQPSVSNPANRRGSSRMRVAGETATGGHLVGPLGQNYEVRPGQSLSDIADAMGIRHSDGMGGVGYTPMRVTSGWDPVTGKAVKRIVPDSAASRGMPTIDWNVGTADFQPGGSASPHALTFGANKPNAAVRLLANPGGGGGGRSGSGGFTTGDYARMKASADLQGQRDDRLHEQALTRAEQSSLLAMERDIAKARLNAPAMPESPLMAAIRSLFPSAPALPAPAATAEPQQKGTVSIRPAVDGKVSMYDRVKDLFLGSGDASPVDGLKGLIDDADSVLRDVLAKAKTGFGLPSNNPVGNGSDTLRMLENLGGGTEAPVQQPDDIASVYAGGGSVFGQGSVTGGPLDYLRTPADGGDAGLESDEYASSMGGMIGALLRV